jgi:ABC-2 type transport system permease protein
VGWLRWLTPLGWAEELRPFTGAQPLVLFAPVATGALLIAAAARIAARRDVGTGLLASHDSSRPRLGLLSSATAQALRGEGVGLLVWTGAVGAIALVIGVVSKSVSSLGISKQLEHTLAKLGAGSALSPKAYIGFSFSFFVLAVSLFAVSQIAAARHEEADERLETLLALPLSRRRWFGGRLALAAASAVGISLCAGLFAWIGAVSQGVSLSLPKMLEAGANCIPAAIVFLGIAALAYAALPRAGSGIAYGVLVVAYLWQLFGALLGAPKWLVHATPFAHVGAVPAVAFRPGAAVVMLAIGLLAALAAIALFERRDLLGA